MKERDYIDATNLAKLRIALRVLHDCLPMDDEDRRDDVEAMSRIKAWRDKLERKVTTE